MSDRARQAVKLGHDEGVALPGEVDGGVQFRPYGDAGHLLLECVLTAGLLKLDDLGAPYLQLRLSYSGSAAVGADPSGCLLFTLLVPEKK
jgi:hypothetical protein